MLDPRDIHGLIVAMEHKGAQFYPNAPDVWVMAPPGALNESDRALLMWYSPWIFQVLIAYLRALGQHFCAECSIRLRFDTPPPAGATTVCTGCAAGMASWARLIQLGRHVFGPRLIGLN